VGGLGILVLRLRVGGGAWKHRGVSAGLPGFPI